MDILSEKTVHKGLKFITISLESGIVDIKEIEGGIKIIGVTPNGTGGSNSSEYDIILKE